MRCFFRTNDICTSLGRQWRPKVQVGFNGWGNGSGITATYDYGISKLISVGAGANFYFSGYKDDNKDNNFLHLVD